MRPSEIGTLPRTLLKNLSRTMKEQLVKGERLITPRITSANQETLIKKVTLIN